MQMRKPASTITACATATLLTACGGGSGGGNDGTVTLDDSPISNQDQSSGTTRLLGPASDQPVAINADNVRRLAAEVMQSINGAGALGSGDWQTGSFGGLSGTGGFDFSRFSENRFDLGAILAAQGLADGVTENECGSGGTVRLETTGSEDGVISEGDQLTATFSDCTLFEGIGADGGFAFLITAPAGSAFSPDARQLAVTVTDFAVQLPGRQFLAHGGMSIASTVVDGNRVMTLSSDAFSYQSSDSAFKVAGITIEKRVDAAVATFSLSASGVLAINNGSGIDGTVTIATPTPWLCSLEGACSAGEMSFTGLDGSSASLAAQSGGDLLLKVYENGELTSEKTIATSWDELRAQLPERSVW